MMFCLSSAWSQIFTCIAPSGQTLYYGINDDYSISIVHPHPIFSSSSSSWAGYSCPAGNVIIPDSIYFDDWNMWMPVTTIGSNAFRESSVVSVSLPSTITSIGDRAFNFCQNLLSVEILDGVLSIGEYAFASCYGLDSIIIPNSVTSIGERCFTYCTGLNSISLSNNLTTIEEYTFLMCSSLSSIVIPNSVNSIEEYAFSECRLDSIILPNSVLFVGVDAFQECDHLKKAVLPNGLSILPSGLFGGCDSLMYVTMPDSLIYINHGAFSGCSSLKEITIPDKVTTIYGSAFSGCSGLTSITIGSGLKYVIKQDYGTKNDNCFSGSPNVKYFSYNCNLEYYGQYNTTPRSLSDAIRCGGVQTLIIGDNVSTCGRPFGNLKSVQIGNGITSIPNNMFANCDSLRYVKIGNNVTSIGSNAFYRCLQLDTIEALPSNAPVLESDAFTLTRPNKKVIVPCSSNYDSVWGTTGFVYITGGYTLTLNSNNTAWGNASFVQQVDCDQTAIIEATPTVGYRFVQWSDGNNDNPRTITLSQNTTLTAVFEAHNVNVSATSNNEMMGTVVGGGSIPVNGEVTLSASPACGHRFVMWNDSITSNPRTFNADKDTSFIAYFELAVDTIELHDTTYINVPMHDTTIIIDTVTLTEYVPVHDTTYIDVHDTTYINVPVHDTTYIDVHDTTYINIPIHDTTIITDTVMLTEYVSVHDTTYINVHDTTYINVPVHDTTVVTDTVIVSVHDTTYITQTDTLTVTQYDTIDNYIHDTLTITDTLWLTQYDTILIHDTIFIHDTIVVGVGDVETVNAKIYTNNRQIVVEGADGNDVCLYDINGRILATKQDYGVPIRFDAPASGTYMIKIGDCPARKVVVIR